MEECINLVLGGKYCREEAAFCSIHGYSPKCVGCADYAVDIVHSVPDGDAVCTEREDMPFGF